MKHRIKVISLYGEVSTISGTPIVIPGFERYSFLFHKHEHMKGYGITEVTTGLQIFPYWEICKNKVTAIGTAERYLEMYHRVNNFEGRLQTYLDENNGGKPINEPLKAKKTKIKQQNLFE